MDFYEVLIIHMKSCKQGIASAMQRETHTMMSHNILKNHLQYALFIIYLFIKIA